MSPNHVSLPIDDIVLDQTNPRIQRALDMYGSKITAEQISLALREGADDDSDASSTTFNRLRNSITKNQGIINPIVVNHVNNQHICIEGNTRLLIYRDLLEKAKKKDRRLWETIPCLVYSNAGDEEVDAIRLQAHLIGPRPWDPYSKARYLNYLWEVEYLSEGQIVDYCGGNKKQIRDSIAAFKMVEEVYKPCLDHPEHFDHTRFSGFVEYQDRKVHRSVMDAGFSDKDFSMWLHDKKTKIQRLEHVRSLPDILKNDEAREAFLASGSIEAIRILNQPSLDELMEKHDIREILEAVRYKISQFSYEEIIEYKEQADELVPVIDDAVEEIVGFRGRIV